MSNNNNKRDDHTVSDECNGNRKKLKCCQDMIKAVNTGLIDWFNEFYGKRYYSFGSSTPIKGYYIFSTDKDKAIMQIHFCPFCSKNLNSL